MALITAAVAREALPALSGPGEDTLLGTLIDQAGVLIADYLGYPPASAGATPTAEDTTYTLYVGRGRAPVLRDQQPVSEFGQLGRVGLRDGVDVLRLPVRPVVSVTSIHDDPSLLQHAADTLVASTDYYVDQESGQIELLPNRSHAGWSEARGAVKVVCVAGFATIPAWLSLACKLLVRHLWDLRRAQGRASESAGGVSISLRDETMPAVVAEILAPHRILLGGCA